MGGEQADSDRSPDRGAEPETDAQHVGVSRLREEIQCDRAAVKQLREGDAALQARIGGLRRLADDQARAALDLEARVREKEALLSALTGAAYTEAAGKMVIQDSLDADEIARSADPSVAARTAVAEEHAEQAQRARKGKAARREANPDIVSDDTIRTEWEATDRAMPGRGKTKIDWEVVTKLKVGIRRVERARRGK